VTVADNDNGSLLPVAENVWCAQRRQRYKGVEVGARMTVLRLAGGILVHSPIDESMDEVEALGTVRWILAPNLLHHLYLGSWAKPSVELWGGPGLDEKRPDIHFDHIIEAEGAPFGPEILVLPLRCFDTTRELLLLHRPSRSLIVTDLFFNFGRDAPWFTRSMMFLLGGYPGPKVTVLERLGMNRSVARDEITRVLKLDFERVIPAHGAIISSGGREALADAFKWLLR